MSTDPTLHDAETAPPARGVVLAPAGSRGVPGLAVEIERRDWHLAWCTDAALAMAELCLQDRTHSSRAAWGLGAEGPVVLVLAPTGAADEARIMKDLVQATRRHLPDAEVWLHHDGRLVPLGAAAVAPAAPRPRPAPARATPPPLPRAPHDDDPDLDDPMPARVTADELDMLFASDTDEVSP